MTTAGIGVGETGSHGERRTLARRSPRDRAGLSARSGAAANARADMTAEKSGRFAG